MKKIISIVLLSLLAVSLIFTTTVQVNAGTKESLPKTSSKYFSSNNNPFRVNKKTGGNCTWYAYGMFCKKAGKIIKLNFSKGSNAVNFYTAFPSECKRSKTPKKGDIICWGSDKAKGEPGLVGYVTKVKKNTKTGTTVVTFKYSSWNYDQVITSTVNSKNNYKFVLKNNFILRGFIHQPK